MKGELDINDDWTISAHATDHHHQKLSYQPRNIHYAICSQYCPFLAISPAFLPYNPLRYTSTNEHHFLAYYRFT